MLQLLLVAVAVPLVGCDDDTTSPLTHDLSVENDMSAGADMGEITPGNDMTDVADASMVQNDDMVIGPDMRPEPGSCAAAGNVQLCDDFESGMVKSTVWQTLKGTGTTVAVDTAVVYKGTYSLHIHQPALTAGDASHDGRITETMTLNATPQPDIYVRAFYYLSVQPTNVATIMATNAGGVNANGFNMGHLAQFGPTYSESPNTTLTVGAWSCLEWHIKQDPTAGELHLFLNGTEVPNTMMTGNTQGGGINVIQLGVPFFVQGSPIVAQPAADYYIDNVIVDSAPIGCTK
jgi:hypothetical protein